MRWTARREGEGEGKAIVLFGASAARTADPEIGARNKTFTSVWKVQKYLERRAVTRLKCCSARGSRKAAGLPLNTEHHPSTWNQCVVSRSELKIRPQRYSINDESHEVWKERS